MSIPANESIPIPAESETGEKSYPYLLESPRPLPDSMIWKLLGDFYRNQGVNAWRTAGVPRYITSNPFIANSYVRMVEAFLDDFRRPGVRERPGDASSPTPLIVELGAGSGAFAFHFLRSFVGDDPFQTPVPPFRYLMTDLADDNLRYLRQQTALRKYREAGLLEFAPFDLRNDRFSDLPDYNPHAPLILIANYVLDSVPQDVFRITQGTLGEGLISLYGEKPREDLPDSNLIQCVEGRWEFRDAPDDFYAQPAWNDILRYYKSELREGTFRLCPTALRILDLVTQHHQGPSLLMAADRGEIRLEDMEGAEPPAPSPHGDQGCFSMGVNFHALELLTHARGGRVLKTEHQGAWLNVVAHTFAPGGTTFPNLERAYEQHCDSSGPDDFYTMLVAVEKKYAKLSMAEILALLRFSRWDPAVFLEMYPIIFERLRTAEETQKFDLSAGLPRVRAAVYETRPDDNIDYKIGYLEFFLNNFESALQWFLASIQWAGPNADVYYNIALCCRQLGRDSEASMYVEQALELDSTNSEALELRAHLMAPDI